MALHSLLFSPDQEIVTLVVEALKGLDIEVAHCSGASEAVERLSSTRFDAIIVDNSDAPAAVVVLSAAKSFASCEHSIGVVLAASRASIGLADGARSHMVLYRPLSADRLRNGIKSALKLRNQGEDARESQRAHIAMKIPATLRGAGQDEALGFIINLSAGGAALQVGPLIPSSSIHSIEFFLPHTNENLSCPVELVWRDVHGRVGVRFAGQSTAFGERLEKWVADQPVAQKAAKAGA